MISNGHKQALHFDSPPQRVVSLVPSLTESLFDMGLGQAVVGITDYCLHPTDKPSDLTRVGGPKNPHIETIIGLQPDLVFANQEENTPETVYALEAAGLAVWMTFPQTVSQAVEVLQTLAAVFQSRTAATRVEALRIPLAWQEAAGQAQTPQSYFCPIWAGQTGNGCQWWMTFNQHTYASDVLRLAGGKNLFAERQRRYPLDADLGLAEPEPEGKRDTRYPRLLLDEIRQSQPELILLPSEPYAFGPQHVDEMLALLPDTPAAQNGRVFLVDGSLITWHGTRLAHALRELPALFSPA